jgi:RNA polymerase sigma factor (sigma-70 family)
MSPESPLQGEGDRFLISAIQGGDAGAYRQLVEKFNGRLTAFAARRLSGTGIDAEDAVQEAFLGFLQSIDRLCGVRSLEAYLFRILQNKISDMTGKRPEAHGLHRVPLAGPDSRGDSQVGGYDPVAPGGTPSSYVRRDESVQVRDKVLADILDEAIRELKDEKNFRDLKVLELLFFSSWRNREIASVVGVSEPTVTRVKTAALEKLARLAARHPQGTRSGNLLEIADDDASSLIRETWRENLLSCVKRSTLGAYVLGVLDETWRDYISFHIDVAGCETCAANLADLKSEGTAEASQARERVFQSSIGFLRKMPRR